MSIITPTFQRQQFLPLLHRCVSRQTLNDVEWLVLDDSPQPCAFMQQLADAGGGKVRYWHVPSRMTVGAKRNFLVQNALGRYVAHFDDDDHYGRDYLARMIQALRSDKADFVKLFGWFIYSTFHDAFAYWDVWKKAGMHYVLTTGPLTTVRVDEHDKEWSESHWGYGFSYVYRKTVWRSCGFPDVNWNEDANFAKRAGERFKLIGINDDACSCLHVVHSDNSSHTFPQYILPRFLLSRLFPDLELPDKAPQEAADERKSTPPATDARAI